MMPTTSPPWKTVPASPIAGGNRRLFVLPPRSPKLNGAVERAQRTHTEEFYEVTASSLELEGA